MVLVLPWLGHEGVVRGNQGAGNLLIALLWMLALYNLYDAVPPKRREAARAAGGERIERGIDTVVGFVMAGYLVWYGWWATAIAAAIFAISSEALIEKKPRER